MTRTGCAMRCTRWSTGIRTWRPASAQQFDEPVQIIPADPVAAWRYVELGADDVDVDEQIQQVCAGERAAVCDLADQPAFRVALIRTAPDRHRLVLTIHHIVMDGWSLPILLGEIFAGYYGQRLPAAVSVSQVCYLAGRSRPSMPPRRPGVRCWPVLTPPPWSARRVGWGWAREAVASCRVPEETTRAVSELARSRHTTVNTVLQAAFAQLLMWLTGQHDVAFGTAVSGRPAEVVGADSMVGLLINTVPVRANITRGNHHRRSAGPAAKRPQRHPGAPAPGAQRDPPHHRAGPAVRHPVRVRELPGRHRRVVRRQRVGHHRVHHPRIQPLPADGGKPPQALNWVFASNIDTDVFDAAQHRSADRAVAAGVGGDDRRPDPAVVVDGCARRG